MALTALRPRESTGTGELTVPDEALALFIDLDVRGFVLVQMPNGSLRVGRKDGLAQELSEADRTGIKRWKLHLLALVGYCADTT